MADLSQVLPGMAAGLGAHAVGDAKAQSDLGIPDARHAVICLLDGLGSGLLDHHADAAPTLALGARTDIDTVFPATTPAALASLGTGLLPGAHGLVGASFLLPETGEVLAPLSWGRDPAPLAVQPEPTLFERLSDAGVQVRTVSAPTYSGSGLTRAVLRGATYVGVDTMAERLAAVSDAVADAPTSLTYVYWPTIDRVGHEHGAGSGAWRDALSQADALISGIVERLPSDAVLLVTADHGMVNCPAQARVSIDDDPALRADVVLVAGEPRARHLYVREGAVAEVERRWRDRLGDRAQVMRRDAVVDSGLMGAVADFAAERLGDLVVIANGDTSITSSADPLVSSLVGQHGALTPDERRIPLIRFDTCG